MIRGVYIPSEQLNTEYGQVLWMESSQVASLFRVISQWSQFPSSMHGVRNIKALSRILAIGWVALLGGILNLDNSSQHKKIIINVCSMCFSRSFDA